MFRYYLLGGDTAAPNMLYARLCHSFLVCFLFSIVEHTLRQKQFSSLFSFAQVYIMNCIELYMYSNIHHAFTNCSDTTPISGCHATPAADHQLPLPAFPPHASSHQIATRCNSTDQTSHNHAARIGAFISLISPHRIECYLTSFHLSRVAVKRPSSPWL